MKYTATGRWIGHNETWVETADNERELLFIYDKITSNGAVAPDFVIKDENGNELDKNDIDDIRLEMES